MHGTLARVRSQRVDKTHGDALEAPSELPSAKSFATVYYDLALPGPTPQYQWDARPMLQPRTTHSTQ